MKRRRAAGLLAGMLAAAPWRPAVAAFPAPYAPMTVQPTGQPERHEFDLTPALARAAREGKRLYVYLGAHDCPFCRRYEAFLARHADELVREFAKDWIVVDLRSSLAVRSERLYFRVRAKSLPYGEFMRELGDERERQLVYPSVWLFDARARPLMQMPAGTGTFETVEEQLEILRLQQ
jgi:hypothetical protein